MLDEHEPALASSRSHHEDEAGPSTTSTDIDVLLPPADPWHLYYSCIFLTLFSYIYKYYMVHVFYVHVAAVLNLHVCDHHDVYIVR